MKIPHFYSVSTRLGTHNIPIHQKVLNVGVEEGAETVLSTNFLKNFSNYKLDEFEFTNPEKVTENNLLKTVAKESADLKSLILRTINEGEVQVVVGGDHSITFPSLLAVLERKGSSIGYIQFDSHGDCNSTASSPTGNFHGIYMRPFFTGIEEVEIQKLVPGKLNLENVLYIGNLDLDGDEPDLFKRKGIKNINRSHINKDKAQCLSYVKKFIQKFNHLHISFDVDVFDHSVVSATGIPAKNGLMWNDVEPFLHIIAEHPSFSFDLAEVNPRKEGAKETIKIAQDILKIVLG